MVSTTAYGVYGDKIAGGFAQVGSGEQGYIYDMTTGDFTTYNAPGATVTHFEGITSAGRAGEYNLVADWVGGDGLAHAGVLHLAADGTETWYELAVPTGAKVTITSANSIYQDTAIGVYVCKSKLPNPLCGGGSHGYVVSIPGIYNPISNSDDLVFNTHDTVAIAAAAGDDVVNDGTITMAGPRNVGIQGRTYGVITNNGSVAVTGPGSAAVKIKGMFGSLLNGGTISAGDGAYAVKSGGTAQGTLVVNTGVIDGRVKIVAGPDARFENSGWLGISSPGAGTTHMISGVFAQTAAGTLALRISGGRNDALDVDGAARLAGTVMPTFLPGTLHNSYTILSATDEVTGTFDTLTPVGLPSFVAASLDYTATDVELDLKAELAHASGLTRNQRAVGAAFDRAFNSGGGIPDKLNAALFGLSASQLGTALSAQSGEVYASVQTVLLNDALFGREGVLRRLRQLSYAGPSMPDSVLGYAGAPAIAPAAAASAPDPTFWAQGLGAWGNIDGNRDASAVSDTFGGILAGLDMTAGGNWDLGLAVGYSYSNSDIAGLASSAKVDTGLIAGYAGTSMGAWKLRAGGTYGLNFIDTSRSIVFPGSSSQAAANYYAGTSQLFGEVGYSAVVEGIDVEPFGGLAWVHLNTQGFKESGGASALKGYSGDSDTGYSSLGIRAAASYVLASGTTVTPRVSAAWQHAFGDLTPAATLAFANMPGSKFTVTGVPLAPDVALVDAGADVSIGRNAKLGLSYFGMLGGGTQYNSLWGSFTRAF